MSVEGCARCGRQMQDHSQQGGCPDGEGTYTFAASPEVIDFIKAHPDASSKELADLWIDRVIARSRKKSP